MKKFQASLLALSGGVSYGLLSGFTKQAYAAGVTTGPLTTFQNLAGALLLWLLALLAGQNRGKVTREQVVKLLLVGTLPGLTGAFYYLSLADLPAAVAIVLLFQFTWLGGLLEFLMEGRRPGLNHWLALACLIPGTLLAVGQLKPASFAWQGVVFGLLSAVTYAGFLYCTGRVVPEVSPWIRSPLIISGSCLINLVVFPPLYLTDMVLTKQMLTGDLFLWGTLMGIFGPVIPTVCFTFGVPVIGGGLAALLGAVELPTVVLVAYFLLGEPVNGLQWLGVLIILAGIYFGERETMIKPKP